MNLLRLTLRELRDWAEAVLEAMPGEIGIAMRRIYFDMRLSACGLNLAISNRVTVTCPFSIDIGHNCYFGRDCRVYATPESTISIGNNFSANTNVMINARGKGKIVIGDNVSVGPNVVLRANDHVFERSEILIKDQGMTEGAISIGNDVWIAANAVILKDVSIGDGAVIAAGAIVTHNIAPYVIVGGVPARVIGERKNEA